MVRYFFENHFIDKTYPDIEAAFKDIWGDMHKEGYKDYNIYERIELADGNAFWQRSHRFWSFKGLVK